MDSIDTATFNKQTIKRLCYRTINQDNTIFKFNIKL